MNFFTIPVLPRLKVSIRIVSGTQFTVRLNTSYLWIRMDWIHNFMDLIGLDWVWSVKRTHVQL